MAQVYHTKRRELTGEELDLARKELVEGLMKIDEIEAEKAEAVAEFKTRMSPWKKQTTKLMRMVRTGIEEGSEYCRVVVDTVTQTVKFIYEKKIWDDETQTDRIEDVLFDELTFEQVGEKQLSMWQEDNAQDSVLEAYERISDDDHDVLQMVLDASGITDEDSDGSELFEVFSILANPWPAKAAELWLKYVGSPSTNVNIHFTSRPIDQAMTAFYAGYELLKADGWKGDDAVDQFAYALFPAYGEAVSARFCYELAHCASKLGANAEADDETEDAEPVEAEQNQH